MYLHVRKFPFYLNYYLCQKLTFGLCEVHAIEHTRREDAEEETHDSRFHFVQLSDGTEATAKIVAKQVITGCCGINYAFISISLRPEPSPS